MKSKKKKQYAWIRSGLSGVYVQYTGIWYALVYIDLEGTHRHTITLSVL